MTCFQNNQGNEGVELQTALVGAERQVESLKAAPPTTIMCPPHVSLEKRPMYSVMLSGRLYLS